MKKVFWITPESFLDVDMPIIENLASRYDLYWLIIGFGNSSKKMYTKTEVELFAVNARIKYKIIAQKYRFRNPFILLFYFGLIYKIHKFQTELVYTSYLGEPIFLNLLRVFFKKNRVVIAIHDVELHSSEKKKRIKEFYHSRYRIRYPNFHLFSESQAQLFNKSFFNKNILLTQLCIKDFGRPSIVKGSDKVRFLFFGNILPYKGLAVLLNAVNHLIKDMDVKDFTLTIAGNCSASDWCEYQKIIEYPEFVRPEIRTIRNDEIADLFCNSDYMVLPYRDVTQCGPLMIAFNYSLPVIASDLKGFSDYISEGETGFLFDVNDFKKLAEIMADCIRSNKRDFIAANMMRMAGGKFSPAAISEQYSQYFEKLFIHL